MPEPLDLAPDQPEVPRAGTAVASVVLSALGALACPIFAVAGILAGISAQRRIRSHPDQVRGSRLAWWGIVLGVLILMSEAALAPLAVRWYRQLAESSRFYQGAAVSMSNLRSVGQAVRMYENAQNVSPDRLDALLADGSLSPWKTKSMLDGQTDDGRDFTFVANQTPKDPADWIIAFDRAAGKGGLILYRNGAVVIREAKEFDEALREFEQKYQAARGEPPVYIVPEAHAAD